MQNGGVIRFDFTRQPSSYQIYSPSTINRTRLTVQWFDDILLQFIGILWDSLRTFEGFWLEFARILGFFSHFIENIEGF